ncbi:hypothetical protein, partial [Pseudomonas helleri]|uniref:hypothetical protein n=1 Tax=Pseudomonas helleri TaxID=1608996 RepID=UPI0037F914EF
GGTLSGRCRSNGYVPKNPEVDGFTAARSRSQSSYLVSDYSVLFDARQRGVEDGAATPTDRIVAELGEATFRKTEWDIVSIRSTLQGSQCSVHSYQTVSLNRLPHQI